MGKHFRTSDEEDDYNEEQTVEQYLVVTKLLNIKEYMVKWHGYSSDDDTWEPQENVAECIRLLKSFWKNVGKENKKHPGPTGTVYNATRDWINKERRHFQEEIEREKAVKEAERKAKLKEKERLRNTKVAKFTVENDAATQSRSVKQPDVLRLFDDTIVVSDSDSDEQPLNEQVKSKKGKEKEVPRTTTASPLTIKLKMPKKPSVQTNSAPTNKYVGMKIGKKPAGTSSQLSSLESPNTSSKPAAAYNTSTSASSVVRKVASGQGSDISEPFLPPRPKSSFQSAPAPVSPVVPSRASGEDVDNFLTTIMPFGYSEAQKPENLAAAEQVKTSAPVPTGLKRWSWTGELFVDTASAADKLCNITIHSTSETSEIGFRLCTILDGKDSLRFSKAYTCAEMNLILQGLRKVDQIAKIGHRRQEDQEPLTAFMEYLTRRNLIIACAGISQLGHVAEMIVFPAANKDFCERLDVPLSYKSAGCLLVALMPWHIPPSKYGLKFFRTDELRDARMETELQEMRREYSSLASKPHIEMAFRILGFDFSFVKFLPSRKFCVWSYQIDAEPTEHGRKFSTVRPETKALFDVLSFLKAKNAGYDDLDARVVFVHVGSVRNIQKLPGIVSRRLEKPEVQFITYGTHESVKPSLWGFHEIYPLGGIVTFTATALLESPFYMAELVEQIHKHPHWECYILPSVLAVFVRQSCPGEDPLSVYTREPYHFGRIFNLIEEGKVAMMQSPGLYRGSRSEFGQAELDKWVATQFSTLSKTPFQLLEDCRSAFVAEYSNKSETELRSAIESEIVRDLSHLQTQQTIRESYRRFVVIKAMQEAHISMSKDGFEWRTAHEFNFGDGFPVHRVELARGTNQPLAA
ncbi:hypothetical protein A7U60_g7871 [Sanghuangporus baumii]|uniref:Chromo domain-containing protein n=1 Tax=Sanghuangporus baumii TaxID=108892 RepID=A0A9Q5HSV3_SANBA|nr:hypothetical protein A7U60_g7871 [Sanghuangporus baumii]